MNFELSNYRQGSEISISDIDIDKEVVISIEDSTEQVSQFHGDKEMIISIRNRLNELIAEF